MAEHCKNCGLELFTAQRFCRSCGAPTEQLSEEQTPTRMMPPQPEGWGARSAATAPTSRAETAPVYDSPPGYQPSVPPMYPAVPPPYAPPRKRSPVGWILAFIGMGLFVLVVVAVMMMARFGRNRFDGEGSSGPSTAATARPGERALDESSADSNTTLGGETVFTKAFALGDEPKLSLKNVNGNITISAWDQPNAEVKVIKRAGSERTAQAFFTNNGGNLSIRTQSRGNQDIRLEVRVPRELGRIDISSTNGEIKLSDVKGEILVDGTNGAIQLTDVVGVSRIKTTNGTIRATLLEASDRGMEFESVNGSIDLSVPPGFEADLDASTVHGSINLDPTMGVQVEKRGPVGQAARGEIGQGGERLRLSTVNGTISLKTAEPRAKGNTKGKDNGN